MLFLQRHQDHHNLDIVHAIYDNDQPNVTTVALDSEGYDTQLDCIQRVNHPYQECRMSI
jgi:hypothetical protein